jgi:transposase
VNNWGNYRFENEIRDTLRDFDLKVGKVSWGRFAGRVTALAESVDPLIGELVLRLLAICGTQLVEYRRMHLLVIKAMATDPICRRLMTIPGVGPVAAGMGSSRSTPSYGVTRPNEEWNAAWRAVEQRCDRRARSRVRQASGLLLNVSQRADHVGCDQHGVAKRASQGGHR